MTTNTGREMEAMDLLPAGGARPQRHASLGSQRSARQAHRAAVHVALRRLPRPALQGRRPRAHGARRAPRLRLLQPRHRTPRGDLHPLRQPPDHQARRDRSLAPPLALRATAHHRGPGRLHRRQRRKVVHGPRRLRHHSQLDVARPRQRGRRPDGVARRPRRPLRADPRRQLLRAVPGALPPAHQAGRYVASALRRRQPQTYVDAARRTPLPHPQLQVRPHVRDAQGAGEGVRRQSPTTA